MFSRVAGLAIVVLSLYPANSFASETVFLNSGFSLVVDDHIQADGVYTFHIGSGTLQFPITEVKGITALPDQPAPKGQVLEHVNASAGGNASTPQNVAASQQITAQQILASQEIVVGAAAKEGVDKLFMKAVAKIESGMRQEAISRKGAIGLMQLMPGTAAELGVDAHNADENASGGARYLRSLLERYKYNPVLTLAAYNAGPSAVSKYKGLPPYYETLTYVVKVLKEYERQLKSAGIDPRTLRASGSGTAAATAKTPSATN